ncbi:phosphate-transport permease PitB [Streptococcus oralis]|uniref:Phosphate-transport permease PitB n=2 Tax=Streptococcus oralis TaxID=1303 RepID=A0A4Q2FN55_STROR|nr:FctA domain-containing protein [Streptococcus oralis]MBU6861969.1 phosphate-transport permease PitB [Streptococcus oralis]MCY7061701.1 phosphate-transport permease PitB [Streptococcus oralis]RXX22861.1 phosphate-transport permease PitB [Streptococcus oralis]
MKKTFLKKLVTASIAAVTALSVFRGVPTFADDNDVATAKANGETSAKVSINKVLNIAEGITTPEATFTFTFTPKTGTSSNGAPYETIDSTNGQITDKNVSYSGTDVLTTGQTSIKKETGDIFREVNYTHAGEYVYTVAEKQNVGWKVIQKNGSPIDSMTYDNRNYEMHVIVKNKTTGGTYISSVYFKQVTPSVNGKVKPSESGTTYKYDLFTNIYRKNAGKITDPNEPNPNKPNVSKVDPNAKSLVIKKVVSGATADKSKDFTFKLTFTKASTETSQSITGKIGETSKTFVYGQETTITLRHDQSLVFDTIPAGTRYKLVETGSQGYTASAAYKENGASKTQAGAVSTNFTQDSILVGEKPNDNTITNNLPDVTPTGLLIDNLPFILMIGLGLAGFVVLSKKRRQA